MGHFANSGPFWLNYRILLSHSAMGNRFNSEVPHFSVHHLRESTSEKWWGSRRVGGESHFTQSAVVSIITHIGSKLFKRLGNILFQPATNDACDNNSDGCTESVPPVTAFTLMVFIVYSSQDDNIPQYPTSARGQHRRKWILHSSS